MIGRQAHGRALLVSALIFAACAKDPEVAKREYVKSGDDYATQGKYAEAIVQYRNAVQQDGRFGEARLKLAEALLKVDNAPEAYGQFVRAADLLPNDVNAQLRSGAMYLVASQFEEARARADKVLALQPTNPGGHILRGNALAGLRDFEAAINEVQAAIAADPSSALTYTDLGRIQYFGGNSSKAEQAFKQAVSLAPDSLAAQQALANFYWSTGKREAAEQTLKVALGLAPKNVEVNRSLAYLYIAMGRSADAEAPLKVVAAETKDAAAQLFLADYYRSTKRESMALDLLDTLAKTPKTYAMARSRKAAVLYGMGRRQDAYAAVQEVLTANPNSSEALLQKSMMLLADDKFTEALPIAQAAVTADPSSVAARFGVGRIEAAQGRYNDAITAYKEVLRLSPRFFPVMAELARLSLMTQAPQDAARYADAALVVQPRNADATLFKARALMALGDLNGADGPMKSLTAAAPNSPIVQAQLGTLYVQRGDARSARAAYEKALKADDANVEALAGLAALDTAARNVSGARARIDAAMAAHGNQPALLMLGARTYSAAGDRAHAERLARKAIEVAPDYLDAYIFLGDLFGRAGRLGEAVTQFEQVATRRPNDIGVPTMIGVLLEMQGKRSDAVKYYERALDVDKQAAVAANNLAMIQLDGGANLDMALQLAQTAKSKLPNQHEVNDTLGLIYVRKGLPALAIGPLTQAVAGAPRNAAYQYHLGLAYLGTRDIDRARAAIEKALALDPKFPEAADAHKALASLKG